MAFRSFAAAQRARQNGATGLCPDARQLREPRSHPQECTGPKNAGRAGVREAEYRLGPGHAAVHRAGKGASRSPEARDVAGRLGSMTIDPSLLAVCEYRSGAGIFTAHLTARPPL